jgi:hypothetical protein
VIQTSYLSEASGPMSAEQLLALLHQCRGNNVSSGVTGMLLYGNGTFLQTLEGDEAVVDALIEKISKDPRHRRIHVLSRRTIERRRYAEWTMGFQRVSAADFANVANVEGLRDFGLGDFNFDFLREHESVSESLMEHYRTPHWDPLIRELDAKDKVVGHLRNALYVALGNVQIAGLVLESLIEASKQGALTERHVQLCETTLRLLRDSRLQPPEPALPKA